MHLCLNLPSVYECQWEPEEGIASSGAGVMESGVIRVGVAWYCGLQSRAMAVGSHLSHVVQVC